MSFVLPAWTFGPSVPAPASPSMVPDVLVAFPLTFSALRGGRVVVGLVFDGLRRETLVLRWLTCFP
eukprot:16440002-Heterocapsa_arctica.AAC.1